MIRLTTRVVIVAMLAALASSQAFSQKISRIERERALVMLDTLTSDLRTAYYDTKFHGIDLNAKVEEARESIKNASSVEVAYANVAAVLESLNDSHTFFVPPRLVSEPDYGWKFQVFGNRCFVVEVKKGSYAERKGLKRGDEVLDINGFEPAREGLWRMKYALETLFPQRVLHVEVLSPDGVTRKLDLNTAVKSSKAIIDLGDMTGGDRWWERIKAEKEIEAQKPTVVELGPELMILKLPVFFLGDLQTEGLIDKARTHKSLIIDLRGDPGGAEDSLKVLVGSFFGKEVKLADRVTRDKVTPILSKANSKHVFQGNVLVLVDSESASASEMFARIIQLENRGIVVGDLTSGSTMESIFHPHEVGQNPAVSYGASITNANLLMKDGKSLEGTGVIPDKRMFPSGSDLLSMRDPVLAAAAEMVGVKMTPETAGKLFPQR